MSGVASNFLYFSQTAHKINKLNNVNIDTLKVIIEIIFGKLSEDN